MNNWQRRAILYLGTVFGAMVLFSVPYHYGMVHLEGEEGRLYVESLQHVVETFTATWYGSDSPWSTVTMNLFVVVMDLVGVAVLHGESDPYPVAVNVSTTCCSDSTYSRPSSPSR